MQTGMESVRISLKRAARLKISLGRLMPSPLKAQPL